MAKPKGSPKGKSPKAAQGKAPILQAFQCKAEVESADGTPAAPETPSTRASGATPSSSRGAAAPGTPSSVASSKASKAAAAAQAAVEAGDKQASKQKAGNRAEWAAFKRSLDAPAVREGSTSKVPTEIARRINAGNQRAYFESWLNSGRDWGKVEVLDEITKAATHESKRKRKWCTEAQIDAHTHNAAVTKALIENAKADRNTKRVRPHPDIPECKEAEQYLVVLDDSVTDKDADKRASGIRMAGGLDEDGGEGIVRDALSKAPGGSEPAGPAGAAPNDPPEDDEAKAKQRKLRQEEVAKKREERKNSPLVQAEKWMQSLQQDVVLSSQLVEDVASFTMGPDFLRTEYKSLFSEHAKALKGIHEKITEIVVGGVEAGAQNTLDNASGLVFKFRQDRKAWKQMKVLYAPRPQKDTPPS